MHVRNRIFSQYSGVAEGGYFITAAEGTNDAHTQRDLPREIERERARKRERERERVGEKARDGRGTGRGVGCILCCRAAKSLPRLSEGSAW